jgi:hypothetical protein
MHPILHAWMILQSMPNFLVRLFAWYIVGGKQLSIGRMNLCRRDKSSSKKLLEQPWVVHMFNKINVVDNFEHLAPVYNGQHASLRSSTLGIRIFLPYMDHLPSHLAFHAYLMCRQCQLVLFDHITCS